MKTLKNIYLQITNMKERIIYIAKVCVAIVALILIILNTIKSDELTPKEMEIKLKQEILELDTKRDSNIKDLRKEIEYLTNCVNNVNKDKGTTEPIRGCHEYSTIIKDVKVIDKVNTGTVTTATPVVPQGINKDQKLMSLICTKAQNSPLCGNWKLYNSLKKITEDRLPEKIYGRMWEILLGISYAESHVGQNYAKDRIGGTCYGRNNWGGTKYQITDDNKRYNVRNLNGFVYKKNVDQYGCNLFPFSSIEEYWTTKVNGMRFGYNSCIVGNNSPIRCMSYKYIGDPNIAEQSWIDNVSTFLIK